MDGIAGFLQDALNTWNSKLAEVWSLLSQSPQDFKGGGVWSMIANVHDGLKAIGYALLVLFFLFGVVKTCSSIAELKRPEVAVKMLVRFVLAQTAITYGMDLLLALIGFFTTMTSREPVQFPCFKLQIKKINLVWNGRQIVLAGVMAMIMEGWIIRLLSAPT